MKINSRILRLSQKDQPNDFRDLGDRIGVDWDKVDFTPSDLEVGTKLEAREHGTSDPQTDVTGGDIEIAAKIAWAHLKESPKYYKYLKEMERKF